MIMVVVAYFLLLILACIIITNKRGRYEKNYSGVRGMVVDF